MASLYTRNRLSNIHQLSEYSCRNSPSEVPSRFLPEIAPESRVACYTSASRDTMSSAINSDELNYLIFRYLQESGFTHTAFMFSHESRVAKSSIDGNLVPPGALVKVILKGIEEIALETNIGDDEIDEDDDFVILEPMDLITKNIAELRRMVKAKKKKKHTLAQKELCREAEEASKQMKDMAIYSPEKQGTQPVRKTMVGTRSKRKGRQTFHFWLKNE